MAGIRILQTGILGGGGDATKFARNVILPLEPAAFISSCPCLVSTLRVIILCFMLHSVPVVGHLVGWGPCYMATNMHPAGGEPPNTQPTVSVLNESKSSMKEVRKGQWSLCSEVLLLPLSFPYAQVPAMLHVQYIAGHPQLQGSQPSQRRGPTSAPLPHPQAALARRPSPGPVPRPAGA